MSCSGCSCEVLILHQFCVRSSWFLFRRGLRQHLRVRLPRQDPEPFPSFISPHLRPSAVTRCCSTIFSAIFASAAVSVGASGAIFSIIGAILGGMCQNAHLMPPGSRCGQFCAAGFRIAVALAVGALLCDRYTRLRSLVA